MNERPVARSRIATILLAASTLLSVVFLVFAFIQKSEADKQRSLAEESRMEAEHQRFIGEQFRLQLEKTRSDLEVCRQK